MHRMSCVYTPLSLIFALLLALSACTQAATPAAGRPAKTSSSPHAQQTSAFSATAILPSPTPPGRTNSVPTQYRARLLLHGNMRPDDLAFDPQGHLLFSDEFNETMSRLNADGSVTLLLSDKAGPEGMVVRPDGTIIFAEQDTNRILSLAPGSHTPKLLRTLPGIPQNISCKHGVDGIAFDPTTSTLIVPDSPTGTVYRMSLDGTQLTVLASGIVRPVGAGVDSNGTIFVADECGGAIWQIVPGGKITRFGGFGMPDDVVPDGSGNLLVIDLDPAIHALIRFNPATGQHETLARQGYIEPQGLVLDRQGDIFVSDDYANMIIEYLPGAA